MIPLVCGDPDLKPASFSRFVLPFAYRLTECEAGAEAESKLVFHPAPPQESAPSAAAQEGLQRLQYLTPETADVLFRRAGWFELRTEEGKPAPAPEFRVRRRGESPGASYVVRLRPPRLVLFEIGFARKRHEDLLATGLLLVDLDFPDPENAPDLDDLLELNEAFRFFRQPYPEHRNQGLTAVLEDCPLDLTDPARTARHSPEADLYLERWAALLEHPVALRSDATVRLFPAGWGRKARRWAADAAADDPGWLVYADHRAFVWTCAVVGRGLEGVRSRLELEGADAADLGHWIKLVNVDRPQATVAATHASRRFEREWVREHTYSRWEEWGTVYSFTYHGGAMLGPPETEPPLWRHFHGIYFDQTLLLLYLRVSCFRFSQRLSRISGDARDRSDENGGRWQREFARLRRDFALFTNLYQFPLVSNHQQGLEMYGYARRSMDVDELFREVQEEIQSTHEYFEIEAAQRQNQETRKLSDLTARLTIVATVFGVLAVVTGFFGMNVLAKDLAGWWRDLGSSIVRWTGGPTWGPQPPPWFAGLMVAILFVLSVAGGLWLVFSVMSNARFYMGEKRVRRFFPQALRKPQIEPDDKDSSITE